VVLDLSTNDADERAFAEALAGFVSLNEERGIATLFALEPNSIEYAPRGPRLHETMRAVGAARGVPVIDLHAEVRKADSRGFLWWDLVHPTSFGHRVIAEALAPVVGEMLGPAASSGP
jgi:lysophospholipase L1-like esterase